MSNVIVLSILGPLALAVLSPLLRNSRTLRHLPFAAATVVLACSLLLVADVLSGSTSTAWNGILRVDALSAFMLLVIGAVAFTSTWAGLSFASGKDWSFALLITALLGFMSLAVTADNLGIMWVAVEATTIATAFLVGHARTRAALEAAWKYVVLGSVGVAIAFLGTMLLYSATVAVGTPSLSWTFLREARLPLDPALVSIAAAMAVLGYATKAGLAPVHSWVPDAYSQAPARAAAVMSGALSAICFYAILRVQAIVDPVLGTGLLRGMLLVGGLLSLALAAALIWRQRDLKRMLAYSSIEHMGLLAIAAAIGGTLAITAALLHVLGHGLAKASGFVTANRIQLVEGTTRLHDIRGLLRRRPAIAIPFLLSIAALLGLPPFSLFFSEVGIVLAGFDAGLGWVIGIALVLVLAVFAGLVRHTARLAFGSGPAGAEVDARAHGAQVPIALALSATAVIGFLTGPFADLLLQAAAAIGAQP